MEEVIMATLPNKELNRLIKIEIAVENLIENGVLDQDLFNEYLKEIQIEEVTDLKDSSQSGFLSQLD